MKLFTKEQFIIQANAKHSNLYGYNDIQFPVKLTDSITVSDPEYGNFSVKVRKHLSGQGHKRRGQIKSADSKRIGLNEFLDRAKKKHGNLYDYSKVKYTSMNIKVCIIDPEYGEFWQVPMSHLNGSGHPTRGKRKIGNSRRTLLSDFIEKAQKIHHNLYDYSKVVYTNCDTKVCIIDPIYGEFWQSPFNHLKSHGCPKRTSNKEWLIHEDHIIPLSILRQARVENKWYEDRPLYKFLNSDVNLTPIPAKLNNEKSDFVSLNGKVVSASTVRNNYEIISHLIKTLLQVDPTDIIEQDKQFINQYFNLT